MKRSSPLTLPRVLVSGGRLIVSAALVLTAVSVPRVGQNTAMAQSMEPPIGCQDESVARPSTASINFSRMHQDTVPNRNTTVSRSISVDDGGETPECGSEGAWPYPERMGVVFTHRPSWAPHQEYTFTGFAQKSETPNGEEGFYSFSGHSAGAYITCTGWIEMTPVEALLLETFGTVELDYWEVLACHINEI